MGRYFNKILQVFDKFIGNKINIHRATTFWDSINYCKIIDLGFWGNKYTRSNMRYINRQGLILERLDRCLANNHWLHLLPDSSVLYHPRTHSDHSFLLFKFTRPNPNIQKPFRVKSMWCNHNDFHNIVFQSFLNGDDLTSVTIDFENMARI